MNLCRFKCLSLVRILTRIRFGDLHRRLAQRVVPEYANALCLGPLTNTGITDTKKTVIKQITYNLLTHSLISLICLFDFRLATDSESIHVNGL